MTQTAYIDRAALVSRISESDLMQRLSAPDAEAKLAQAIEDANSEADLYVGTRYPLPLVAVPAALSRAAADLALYLFAASTGGATQAESDRHAAALALFKSVASGEVRLGESGETDTGHQAPRITSATRRMIRDSLRNLF